MTENKPIMIDGVDIAGCEFHSSTPSSELCYMKGNKCNDNSNCYFKQLARKTQECEELKKQHQADKGLITSTGKQNYQLMQEYDRLKEEKQGLIKDWEEKKNLAYEIACKNEKLKAEIKTYKQMLDNPEVHVALTDVRTGERDLWQKYKPRMEQAVQKLEKIRQIVNKLSLSINWNINKNAYEKLQSIIQIIDEVE